MKHTPYNILKNIGKFTDSPSIVKLDCGYSR